ncbi:hypothetical protein [Abiotrophia defectiva]|uniref:hypothetical protein n=1 Tax=Abiotrophia defectiva TaxID=46125 RepID=UPI0028D45A50|nr:hypothetical protein [Abiotrophia defectiva]
MNEELFAVSYIQELAEYLAKKMVEMNLQVDAVLFIERAGGPYSFEIKCSNRFTREQLKARIKELMTDGETDRIIIERELGKGIYKEVLEEALSELGDENNG